MQILFGLRDFGKIKSAEVNISGFSVFVGNNNSGKTYVMQLIYGIRNNLKRYLKDYDLYKRYFEQMEEQATAGKVTLDAGSMKKWENYLNNILQKNKEKIIFDTFYKKIEIGQIYVRFQIEEDERYEFYFRSECDEEFNSAFARLYGLKSTQSFNDMRLLQLDIFHIMNEKKKLMKSYQYYSESFLESVFVQVLADFLLEFSFQIFLPSSRTGLIMLYKEFFATKTDEAVNIYRLDHKESFTMNITRPVYDFLRFVQTFVPNRDFLVNDSLENKGFIQFIEKHLIEGRILIDQRNQLVYQEQGAQRELPLYLSSSMVNELMPVLYVLQSVVKPRQLIWDEIETSLHPQKQMELVRLLSRMYNAGFSMIVSTHSDTMAAKINNLCLLSFSQGLKGKRAEILKKARLEEADLFKKRIYVYQFENDNNGRSLVRELEFDEVTGYQFSLFQDSVEKLFQETRLILE